MKIEGENLVVRRTHNGHVGGLGVEGEGGKGAGREETSMYQNLDFMNKRGSEGITTANVYMEETDRYCYVVEIHTHTYYVSVCVCLILGTL